MCNVPLIRTERLIVRRLQPADLDNLLAYRNDPEVARFDGTPPLSIERARGFITEQSALPAGVPGVWLQLGIELPGAGLIGDCGFQVEVNTPWTAEVGYRLARGHWGHGYAAEAAAAVLDWAFGPLSLHRVVAYIDTRNTRSIALAERLGFRREGHLLESYLEPGGASDEYLYAMLAREWHARRAS
jgi:RimJ/RimL family protein N-acetyltransferase